MIHRWSSMFSYHQIGIWKCKQELESMLLKILRIYRLSNCHWLGMIHRWSSMLSYHQVGIWKCKQQSESMSSKILRSNLPFIQLSLIGNDPSMIVNVELSSSRDIKMQKKELESMLLKILRIYRLSNCHWLGMIHRSSKSWKSLIGLQTLLISNQMS